jgi:hypothetical protein
MFQKIKRWLLKDKPLTWSADNALPHNVAHLHTDNLPPFHLDIAEQMRFDPQVRIAMGARNGLLMRSQINVTGDDSEVVDFVSQQWEEIWSTSAYQLLRAKLYGFLPFEVMYRLTPSKGTRPERIQFDRLEECHPRQTQLLTRQGKLVGFELQNRTGFDKGVQVLSPKALVCTFGAEFGNWYGCSLLERAYPAWQEKWMKGGAKKTLRLRMIKDSYIGDIFWYPPDRRVELPDGSHVSWRDIAKEIVESRHSGGALTLPMVYDHAGRRLVDYSPPQDLGGATGIFDWKRDVDNEIWKALEVPPEVIEAAERGSGYSGRSIPLLIATAAVQSELAELIACVSRDILLPLVQLNFGKRGGFRVKSEVGGRKEEVGMTNE